MSHAGRCRSVKVVQLLMMVVLLAFSVQAETGQSLVRGRVLDPNGAVIPGANISVEAKGRTVTTTTSNASGEFSLTLEAGEYLLRVSAAGFAEVTKPVILKPDTPGSFDVSLQLAASSAFVTVTDGGGYLTEAVGSATKTLTALRDLPQSVTVVTSEQIKDQSFQGIADVVTYVPGIVSHQGENNRDQLVIRGNSTSAD